MPQATAAQEGEVRLLPLDGGFNFRDLGGYMTTDGRRVRWRRLYRSGKLSSLTGADVARLAAVRIRLVCDLRTPQERAREPSVTGYGALHRAWRQDAGPSRLLEAVSAAGATPQGVRAALVSTYREMPWLYAEPYAAVLRHLADGELPLVFHCAAGKDRTGVLAALIMRALGVPHDAVVEDYLLTDRCLDLEALQRSAPNESPERAAGFSLLQSLSDELRAPLLRCDADFLCGALDAVTQRHGSVAAYLDEVLGLDAAAVVRLQDRLLDDST